MSTSIYSEDTEEEDRTTGTDDESGDNEENEENKDEENKDEENKDEDEDEEDEDEENKDEEDDDDPEPFGVCCFCGDGCNPSSQACGSCMRSCWTIPTASAEVLPSCKRQRC